MNFYGRNYVGNPYGQQKQRSRLNDYLYEQPSYNKSQLELRHTPVPAFQQTKRGFKNYQERRRAEYLRSVSKERVDRESEGKRALTPTRLGSNKKLTRQDSNLQSPKYHNNRPIDMHIQFGKKGESLSKVALLCPYFMSPMGKSLNKPYSQQILDKLYREQFFEMVRMMNSLDQIRRKPRQHKLHLSKAEFYQDKKTILLDLDQTLIHSYDTETKAHFFLTVNISGEDHPVWVNVRPFADTFLANLAKHFQLIVFTASHASYAQKIVNQILDPEDKCISHILSREMCSMSSDGFYFKDLKMLNRDARDMVIVDNSCYSYCFDLHNGIPVVPYYDNDEDQELPKLQKFLMGLKNAGDVRKVVKESFLMQEFKGKSAQTAFEQFFKE